LDVVGVEVENALSVVPFAVPDGPPAIETAGLTVTVNTGALAVVPPCAAVAVIVKAVWVATEGAVPEKVELDADSDSDGEVGACANDHVGAE
jgi:hypothetical protein